MVKHIKKLEQSINGGTKHKLATVINYHSTSTSPLNFAAYGCAVRYGLKTVSGLSLTEYAQCKHMRDTEFGTFLYTK